MRWRGYWNPKHREVERLRNTCKWREPKWRIAASLSSATPSAKSLPQGSPKRTRVSDFKDDMKLAQIKSDMRDTFQQAEAKRQRAADFNICNSVREVLALGKPKVDPKQEKRSATEGEREVGPVKPVQAQPKSTRKVARAKSQSAENFDRGGGKNGARSTFQPL